MNTMAIWTLIILLSEMLNFNLKKKEQNFVKETRQAFKIFEIFYLDMESLKF